MVKNMKRFKKEVPAAPSSLAPLPLTTAALALLLLTTAALALLPLTTAAIPPLPLTLLPFTLLPFTPLPFNTTAAPYAVRVVQAQNKSQAEREAGAAPEADLFLDFVPVSLPQWLLIPAALSGC